MLLNLLETPVPPSPGPLFFPSPFSWNLKRFPRVAPEGRRLFTLAKEDNLYVREEEGQPHVLVVDPEQRSWRLTVTTYVLDFDGYRN